MSTNGRRALRPWPLLLLVFSIFLAGIQQIRSTIVLYFLALVCALVAVQSKPPVIYLAMFGLGVLLVIHLLVRLRNAYSATLFRRLANVTRDLRARLQPKPLSVRPAPAGTRPAPSEKIRLYRWHALAVITADRIDRHVKRKIFELYLMASWFF